jgi:hypothetical protein
MHAQLTYFDGPRTPAQLAAADFAARERIVPAVNRVGGAVRAYVLRQDDGSEVVVSLADTEDDLIAVQKAIMSTELLPGEDPALLPGPDRVEVYPVVAVHERGADGRPVVR